VGWPRLHQRAFAVCPGPGRLAALFRSAVVDRRHPASTRATGPIAGIGCGLRSPQLRGAAPRPLVDLERQVLLGSAAMTLMLTHQNAMGLTLISVAISLQSGSVQPFPACCSSPPAPGRLMITKTTRVAFGLILLPSSRLQRCALAPPSLRGRAQLSRDAAVEQGLRCGFISSLADSLAVPFWQRAAADRNWAMGTPAGGRDR